jgi:CRP-like cAMP-binding protein
MVEECRLFDGFSPEEKELLKGLLEVVEFKEGELLFDEFQEADSFYLILEGVVALYRSDNFGKWTKVAAVYGGVPLGECAFFLGKPHSLRAVAEKRVRALKVKRSAVEKLKISSPKLYVKLLERVLEVMAERLKSEDAKFSKICGFFSVPGGSRWRR